MRDASFVASRLRPEDRREIASLWQNWDTRALGICAMETAVPGMVWSAYLDGQPAAAFGFSRASAFDPDHWQAFAFGTKGFRRCVPEMTRHLQGLREEIENRCRRLQAMSIVGHTEAHRWLESLGARLEGRLRSYGRGGEDFLVYAWVRDDGA